jgi:ribosomal protein L14E/L6E/L27E
MHSISSMQSLTRRSSSIRVKDDGPHRDKVVVSSSRRDKENFSKSCSSLVYKETKETLRAGKKNASKDGIDSLHASFGSLGNSGSEGQACKPETEMIDCLIESDHEKTQRNQKRQGRQRQRGQLAESDRSSRLSASSLVKQDSNTSLSSCSSSSDREAPRLKSILKSPKVARPCATSKKDGNMAVPQSPKKMRSSASSPSKGPSIPTSPKKRSVCFRGAAYKTKHVVAASRIAALARGKRARQQAQYLRLQRRLSQVGVDTKRDIQAIQAATAAAQKEFRARAQERFTKNLARQGQGADALIQEEKDKIAKIRQENTELRAQNQSLYTDIQKLKINNQRLEASKQTSTACLDRIVFHEDTCSIEHAKLVKIAAQYETAVREHEQGLALQTAYGDVEHKMKKMYGTLLGAVWDRVKDHSHNTEMVEEIKGYAKDLEAQCGPIVIQEGKKKKSKGKGKKGKK